MKRSKGIDVGKQQQNFTKIPNMLLDDKSLDVYEVRVLLHIARQTIGYGKSSDGISLLQFHDATGISISKVKMIINSLQNKKLIKVKHQTKKDGGKSYNRYSLTHSHEVAIPQPRHDQGHSHDMAIQKKIEQNMRERILFGEDNIFHSLTEHEQEREAKAYADYVSMDAKRPEAYKAKIMKQIRREHPETLEAFQAWYLKKTCTALTAQYGGRSSGRYEIESIYPYTDTKGYANSDTYEKEHLFYVQFKGAGEDKAQVLGADSYQALKALLDDLTGKGTP